VVRHARRRRGRDQGVFCRRWGVPLIDGGTVRLPRLIGHSRAMDLILTGRGVAPPKLSRWGWPIESCPKAKRANGPRSSPPNSPSFRNSACVRTGCRRSTSGAHPRPRRWTSSSAASRVSLPSRWQARPDSQPAQVGTGRAPSPSPSKSCCPSRSRRPWGRRSCRVTVLFRPTTDSSLSTGIEGDLVVGAADVHLGTGALDGQRVVGTTDVERFAARAIEVGGSCRTTRS